MMRYAVSLAMAAALAGCSIPDLNKPGPFKPEGINYRERPQLVVPPDLRRLPPPKDPPKDPVSNSAYQQSTLRK